MLFHHCAIISYVIARYIIPISMTRLRLRPRAPVTIYILRYCFINMTARCLMRCRRRLLKKRMSKGPYKIILTTSDFVFPQVPPVDSRTVSKVSFVVHDKCFVFVCAYISLSHTYVFLHILLYVLFVCTYRKRVIIEREASRWVWDHFFSPQTRKRAPASATNDYNDHSNHRRTRSTLFSPVI